jgi:hypothetical protein
LSDVSELIIPIVLVIVIIVGVFVVGVSRRASNSTQNPPEKTRDSFSAQQLTESFVAALPSLSPELRLEIASSFQTETIERSDGRSFLGIHLGTNRAEIRVGVTYRYHVQLRDPWLLERKGTNLMVHAPPIRAGLPPAIHTDRMEMRTSRGWARIAPFELLEQLRTDLTPVLNRYAQEPGRISLVREVGRQSVAQFVRLWLEREKRWRREEITSIEVHFADEERLRGNPTLRLSDSTPNP